MFEGWAEIDGWGDNHPVAGRSRLEKHPAARVNEIELKGFSIEST